MIQEGKREISRKAEHPHMTKERRLTSVGRAALA